MIKYYVRANLKEQNTELMYVLFNYFGAIMLFDDAKHGNVNRNVFENESCVLLVTS